MMNLKLVEWDSNPTVQFLMEAKTDDEAIKRAIEVNEKYFDVSYIKTTDDVNDPNTYTVYDVDFDLLCELLDREYWEKGKYGNEVKVFSSPWASMV